MCVCVCVYKYMYIYVSYVMLDSAWKLNYMFLTAHNHCFLYSI